MNNIIKKSVIALIGPTGSGKTSLSLELSKHKDCEIISADSRQIYKNISIATASPTKDEQKKVKHHFVEFLELDEEFNAGEFGKQGRETIEKIFTKNKTPLIVGGCGLYIRSLIDGFLRRLPKIKNIVLNSGRNYKNTVKNIYSTN